MISIKILFCLLFIHWLADFVCQTDEMAKGKAKQFKPLIEHTAVYSLVFYSFVPIYALCNKDYVQWTGTYFVLITFFCHTIQDYFTSRLNSSLHSKGKIHEYFIAIGGDQFLHYVQLILTFYFLEKFAG